MNFKDTELTLGLPGEARSSSPVVASANSCTKRGFIETVDLNLGSVSHEPADISESGVSGATAPPTAKAQTVGWPPVRRFRKKAIESSKYIKVGVDGAPFLRKVDLEMYGSYEELLSALEKMFSCFTISQENKLVVVDPVKRTEYVPTYEDKDGDWMLVGDVPWTMFIESCKRIRLKKSSEAVSLAPKCSSTS